MLHFGTQPMLYTLYINLWHTSTLYKHITTHNIPRHPIQIPPEVWCFRSVLGFPNSEPQFRWPWMPRLPRVCHMEPPQLGMGDTQTHHPMAVQSLFHCDRCPCVQIRRKIHQGQLWEYPFKKNLPWKLTAFDSPKSHEQVLVEMVEIIFFSKRRGSILWGFQPFLFGEEVLYVSFLVDSWEKSDLFAILKRKNNHQLQRSMFQGTTR